jgi:hypothetical protein
MGLKLCEQFRDRGRSAWDVARQCAQRVGGRVYHWRMNDVPTSLPGHELVSAGLVDLAAGRESEASLVVAMAAPRLRALGFEVPAGRVEQPAYRLYQLLATTDDGAHSRYNALVGRIVSFARAAEHASAG